MAKKLITYICLTCGEIFYEPKTVQHYDEEWLDVCPYCFSPDFEKAKHCSGCGQPLVGKYIDITFAPTPQRYCMDCAEIKHTQDDLYG